MAEQGVIDEVQQTLDWFPKADSIVIPRDRVVALLAELRQHRAREAALPKRLSGEGESVAWLKPGEALGTLWLNANGHFFVFFERVEEVRDLAVGAYYALDCPHPDRRVSEPVTIIGRAALETLRAENEALRAREAAVREYVAASGDKDG